MTAILHVQGMYDDGWISPRIGQVDVVEALWREFPSARGAWWVTWTVNGAFVAEGVLSVYRGEVEESCGDGCCGGTVTSRVVVGPLEWGQRGESDMLPRLAAAAKVTIVHGDGSTTEADDGVVQLHVEGEVLDQHADSRHPRYDPYVEVKLAHHWQGNLPGTVLTVPRSLARSLQHGRMIVDPEAAAARAAQLEVLTELDPAEVARLQYVIRELGEAVTTMATMDAAVLRGFVAAYPGQVQPDTLPPEYDSGSGPLPDHPEETL